MLKHKSIENQLPCVCGEEMQTVKEKEKNQKENTKGRNGGEGEGGSWKYVKGD